MRHRETSIPDPQRLYDSGDLKTKPGKLAAFVKAGPDGKGGVGRESGGSAKKGE